MKIKIPIKCFLKRVVPTALLCYSTYGVGRAWGAGPPGMGIMLFHSHHALNLISTFPSIIFQ